LVAGGIVGGTAGALPGDAYGSYAYSGYGGYEGYNGYDGYEGYNGYGGYGGRIEPYVSGGLHTAAVWPYYDRFGRPVNPYGPRY
jgi:hypothetical protein